MDVKKGIIAAFVGLCLISLMFWLEINDTSDFISEDVSEIVHEQMMDGDITVDLPGLVDRDVELYDENLYTYYSDDENCVGYTNIFKSYPSNDINIYCDYFFIKSDMDYETITGKKDNDIIPNADFREIKQYIKEYYSVDKVERDNPEYIASNDMEGGWLRYKCNTDMEDDTAYLYVNACAGAVYRLIYICDYDTDEDRTQKILEESDAIAASFNDEGALAERVFNEFLDEEAEYAEEDMGDEEYDDEYYDDEYFEDDDDDFDWEIILAVIGIVASVLFKIKEKEKDDDAWGAECSNDDIECVAAEDEQEYVEREDNERDNEGSIDASDSVIEADAQFAKPVRYSSNYEESLKTLLKSGILTKKEYEEMVRKKRR